MAYPFKWAQTVVRLGDILLSEISNDLVLQAAVAALRAAGCVFAEEEAQMMISEAKSETELASMIEKRNNGVPLEQILGWAEFCGHRVAIEPEVFIPRYKTEFLVSQAIALCKPDSIVLDLCCGSGALGLAIISSMPTIQLFASDVDPVAVHCARQNLAPYGATVFEGDLFDPIPQNLKGKINILLANAPYVPTQAIDLMPREARLYESRVSLDGGMDGLDIHRRIAASATEWLTPGGYLLIETGKGQSSIARNFLNTYGMNSWIAYSEDHDATVVIGTKSKELSSTLR